MKLLNSKYILIHIGIYLLFRLFRAREVAMPEMVTSYLADLCAMPVILTFILVCIRLIKKDKSIELSQFQVFSVVLYMGVLLEFVFPKYFNYMVSDPFDILVYMLGGVSFIVWRITIKSKPITA